MFRKIANDVIQMKRDIECGDVGPIVHGSKEIKNGGRQLEYRRLLGAWKHVDRQSRVSSRRIGLSLSED
jgi:hypothetical protein